jgi:hypothetical protein
MYQIVARRALIGVNMRYAEELGGVPRLARQPRKHSTLRRILSLIIPVGFVASMFIISAVSGHNAGNDASLALRAAADVNSNNSSFTYVPGSPGVAVSSRQYHKDAPGLLNLTVYGMPPVPGDTSATIYVDLSNGTGQTALFVGGPLVAVTITHDGQPFRQLTLGQPATPSLDPSGVVRLQSFVPLSGGGTYRLSAALVGIGTNPAFTLTSPAAGTPPAP